MPLQSDLSFDVDKLDPARVTEKTHKLNDTLVKLMQGEPKWYEVGAEKYRQMRVNGETPMPKPKILDSGKDITIPSREASRSIPCRVFKPADGGSKGVFYHIHGGGWVLQSQYTQDLMLEYLANHTQLIVVSVGYRLAPEHPYPQPNEDCYDVADWLVDNAEKQFGGPMLFMSGDSAGAHLSVVTAYHVLESRPDFAFKGLVLNFGAYNLAEFLPQARNFHLELILDVDIMEKYANAYLPNTTAAQRRDKFISPFYADMSKMKLPPALFTCGTLDCLMDDSIMMSTKWMMSGAEAILKLYPGAPHGFVFFEIGQTEETERALQDIVTFIKDKS
ncbi:hypothetical protein AMS68_004245 [Peltaster fructicola]|uniref:Alpha/beta hydrolase fold-3 domain-containing protein n=1 Tax=Peltaster fructicola TaxID=286661 RepID=A0A6H0XVU8_9PEZI|nr:hypothetical protein AMS68_004245 [Peltaster fructicola]